MAKHFDLQTHHWVTPNSGHGDRPIEKNREPGDKGKKKPQPRATFKHPPGKFK